MLQKHFVNGLEFSILSALCGEVRSNQSAASKLPNHFIARFNFKEQLLNAVDISSAVPNLILGFYRV